MEVATKHPERPNWIDMNEARWRLLVEIDADRAGSLTGYEADMIDSLEPDGFLRLASSWIERARA